MRALKPVFIFFILILFPLSFMVTASASESTQIVNKAKAEGKVGEKPDGYLGLVTGTISPTIKAAVEEVNIKRKSVYQGLARKEKVSIDIVSALTGEKLIAALAVGYYYYDLQSKKWLKK